MLYLKYPYNFLTKNCNVSWIDYRDFTDFLTRLDELNNDDIQSIKEEKYDKEAINKLGNFSFNNTFTFYYFSNLNIKNLSENALNMFMRLVIYSCTKGKDFNEIENPLQKIKFKNEILKFVDSIIIFNKDTERLLKIYLDTAKEVINDDNIINELKAKIMEEKLKRE